MRQPPSIKRFDMVYLGSLAVYAVAFFLGFDETVNKVREQYAAAGLNMNPAGIVTGSFAVGIVIGLLLWWFISQKRSPVAKWILVVLFALTLLSMVISAKTMFAGFTIATALSLLSVVLEAVAIWLLFQPDTKPWFDKDADR